MRTELVTTLKRQATELLDDLARDREPILITQHGVPSAVLMDVQSYELQQSRMAILEAIAVAEEDLAEGRTSTHAQVMARFEKKWRK
jgi:prevent-host-death family protein